MAQTDFTDNVVITGSRDITQLTVKGNATQTNKLQDWQKSDGTSLASVDKDGKVTIAGFTMAAGAAAGYILQSDSCGVGTWTPAFESVGNASTICNGRLTLTTGTPVTTSDVTAATTIYFTPFKGDWVTLYDGTRWGKYTFSELSAAVPSTTNTDHDVFLYDNGAGSLALNFEAWAVPDNGSVTSISNASPPVVTVASHTLTTDQLVTIAGNSVAANNGTWRVGTTTGTTFQLKKLDNTNPPAPGSVGNGGTWQRADQNKSRATAIVIQNGVWVKSGAGNSKYRYLGTIRTTTTSGQCEDSAIKRYVYNEYNQIARRLQVSDATGSWVYSTSTWRAGHDDLNNRVAVVVGNTGSLASLNAIVRYSANGSGAIGLDSITTNGADVFSNAATTVISPAAVNNYPSVGFHYYQWMEWASGTNTWYGTTSNYIKTGLSGSIVL